MQQVEISENDYPSKEKIWDRLYQCRDFELSHFWQKSVFLFTLLSLCFGGYGVLVAQIVNTDTKQEYLPYIYQYMCGISLLGIILSILWIYMAKGSKAWYEVYEKSIYEIETEIFKNENRKYIEGEFAKRLRKDLDISFWNNKQGAFSPSKINMVIGWIMLIVWCVCGFFSMYNFLEINGTISIDWGKIFICLGLIVFIAIIAPLVIRLFIKSSPLLQSKYKNYLLEYCKFEFNQLMRRKYIMFIVFIITIIATYNYAICALFIIILIACFLGWIYRSFNKRYYTFVKKHLEDIKEKDIKTVIDEKVNNYVSDHLKDDMIASDLYAVKLDQKYEGIINKKVDEFLENRINDDIEMIIEKIIGKRISEIIGQKVHNMVDDKVNKVASKLKGDK